MGRFRLGNRSGMDFGISQSSVGILTCCCGLGCRHLSRSGLVRCRSAFVGAFCLNLLGVEHAICSVRAFDQILRVVLECVARRLSAAIRNMKLQSLLIDREISSCTLPANAAW